MAKYCDHLAYGNYSTTPSGTGWPLNAQDGNGKATTTGTSAIASIVFTGIPSGTISVCGVTCSPTFATNADTSANNLASWINGSSATGSVTTTGFRSSVQLRNAVYARGPSSGAPAGTCQIMSRHASADINGQVCIAHSLTNVDAGSSSLNFSGGTDGCWGFIVSGNSTVQNVWPQAITPYLGGYGLWGNYRPFAGSIDDGDIIYLRAKTVNVQYTGTGYTIGMANQGSAQSPVTYVVDDGSVWTADAGTDPVLEFDCTSYLINFLYTCAVGFTDQFVVIKGQVYSSGVRNLKFKVGGTFMDAIPQNAAITLIGADFVPTSTNFFSFTSAYLTTPPNILSGLRLVDCRILIRNNANALINHAQYGYMDLELENCVIECDASVTTPHAGLITSHSGGNAISVVLNGCIFKNFTSGSRLHAAGGIYPAQASLVFKDCDFGGVSVLGPGLSHNATNGTRGGYASRNIAGTSINDERDFFFEAQTGFVQWLHTRFPPTCYAKQLDGINGYVFECVPTTSSLLIAHAEPMRTPTITKINSLDTASRTFKCEIAVDDRLSWAADNVALTVRYVDQDGNLVYVSSYADTSLTSSSTSWSSESGGLVVFGANGSTHNKYVLSVASATGRNVATGSRIEACVEFFTSVTDVTHVTLVDPEVTIV